MRNWQSHIGEMSQMNSNDSPRGSVLQPRRSGPITSSWRARAGAAREPDLDLHDFTLIHWVTSPQAFDRTALAGRPVCRPDLTLATGGPRPDHRHRQADRRPGVPDPVETLRQLRRVRHPPSPGWETRAGHVHVVGAATPD